MKLYHLFDRLKFALAAMHLSDLFLLIFMSLFLLQSAHNLFSPASLMQESSAIDVVVHTTMPAIFGYFISAHFQNKETLSSENAKLREESLPVFIEPPVRQCATSRTVIVASIGLFSLLLLIISRNHFVQSSSSIATISQLRDFVSGSVGFLIGCPTTQPKTP